MCRILWTFAHIALTSFGIKAKQANGERTAKVYIALTSFGIKANSGTL